MDLGINSKKLTTDGSLLDWILNGTPQTTDNHQQSTRCQTPPNALLIDQPVETTGARHAANQTEALYQPIRKNLLLA